MAYGKRYGAYGPPRPGSAVWGRLPEWEQRELLAADTWEAPEIRQWREEQERACWAAAQAAQAGTERAG